MRIALWARASQVLLFLAVAQCGSGAEDTSSTDQDGAPSVDDAGGDTDTGTLFGDTDHSSTLRGPCLSGEEYGAFNFVYNADQAGVEGQVRDGFIGSLMDEIYVLGDCRLLQKRIAVCNPACSSGLLCTHSGDCVVFPTNQDVGTVTVEGAAEPIALIPRTGSNLYFDTTLSSPPFSPGDELILSADGGAFHPFVLYGKGIELLSTDDTGWTVSRGRDIVVTWTAGEETDAFVSVHINVDQHGLSPALIECETRDTGALNIPAAIVDALLELGISGKPSGTLARRTVDSVETDLSCVSFTVETFMTIPVTMGEIEQ